MMVPVDEQEVVIQISRDESAANVYASDSRYINKFDKLCEANPAEWKFIRVETCQGDVVGKFYTCPAKFVSFRRESRKVELTDEQKAARAERMREIQRKRREKKNDIYSG